MDIKYLLYLGSDSDFYKELSYYSLNNAVGEFSLLKEPIYSKGCLIESLADFMPGIVYIDFSLSLSLDNLLAEIIYIKRNETFRNTLFVAIFPDYDTLISNEVLLTVGFQLFFVKGLEAISLFRDSFYIAFDSVSSFPEFSSVNKINKKITMGVCSTLYSIVDNEFIVETDIEVPEDDLIIKLPIFTHLTNQRFKIKDRSNVMANFPMTTAYVLDFPIAGPWMEVSNDFLQQETIDTWKEFNQGMQGEELVYIKIYSKNRQLLREVFRFYDPSLFHISFNEIVDMESLANELVCKKMPLVFFDIDDEIEKESYDSLKELALLLSAVSDPLPIVICTRNSSKTQKVQELLNFPRLLCFETALNGEIFSSITKSLISKRKKVELDHYFFAPSASNRIIDVKFEVLLICLTEHEITFSCSVSLPMFSVLHFNLPIKFIATVVPSLFGINSGSEKNQYMAFINGVDENNLSFLRKFINQVIFNPPPDYSEESISQVVKSMNAKVKKNDTLSVTQVIALKEEKHLDVERKDAFMKSRFKGKSKL